MRFFFADDGRQKTPTRSNMGTLVAIGGCNVPDDHLGAAERDVGETCEKHGFPPGEEFKWSPNRNQWMYANLVGDKRRDFFFDVLTVAGGHGITVLAVIEDIKYDRAVVGAATPEDDVTAMFLERVDTHLRKVNLDGLVFTDRPGGQRADEDRFLLRCVETVQAGRNYVGKPSKIALPVFTASSNLSRLAQFADLVTSCTLSFVAGEPTYAPRVFQRIRPLLSKDGYKVGGIGLKIHPDTIYANLYHWLLGDSHLYKGTSGIPLPIAGRPYATSPDVY